MLRDDYSLQISKAVNDRLKKIEAPFFVLCSTRKKDGKIQETWRRTGKSCDKDFVNSRWVSEKDVDHWLQKNLNTNLANLRKGNISVDKPGPVERKVERNKMQKKAPIKKTSGPGDLKKPEEQVKYKSIKVLSEHHHLTAQEKAAIRELLNENEEMGGSEYKYYTLEPEDKDGKIRVYIDTYETRTIGKGPEWSRRIVNIKAIPEKTTKSSLKKKAITSKDLPGLSTTIETQAENIKSEYYLMELDSLVPSHLFTTFAKNKKYPANCQERNYHTDKQEQTKVNLNAKNLKAAFLINEDPTAVGGPPIITSDKIVLGGNSRVMSMQRAASSYPDKWKAYVKFLKQRLSLFGYSPDDLQGFKKPVLVRVIDIDLDRCSHYSWVLNTGLTQEISSEDRGITFAKDISTDALNEIGMILEEQEVETLAQLKKNKPTTQRIVKILEKQGIITNTNRSKWIDPEGKLKQDGETNIENILIGSILTRKGLLDEAKSYSNKIIQRIPYFLRMKRLPGEWNLVNYFEAAIAEIPKMYDAGYKLSQREQYLRQINAFENEIPELTKLAWEILELPIKKFKIAIKKLTEVAEQQSESSGKDAMFEVEKITPQHVMKDVLKRVQDDQLNDQLNDQPGHDFKIGEVYNWDGDFYLISGIRYYDEIVYLEVTTIEDGEKKIDFIPKQIFDNGIESGKIELEVPGNDEPEPEDDLPEDEPEDRIEAIKKRMFTRAGNRGLGDKNTAIHKRFFI